MDTIARFVTVRNPAKPSQKELDSGFITYEPALAASLADEASTDEDVARRRAITYCKGTDFASSPKELRDRAPGLYDLGELLELRRDQVTKKDLDTFLTDHDVAADPDVMAWLWDNLVAHWFAGGPADVRDAIIWMLRAARVREHIDDKNLDALGEWATAVVVVPGAGMGRAPDGDTDDDGNGDDGSGDDAEEPERSPEEVKRAKAFDRITSLRAAAEELQQLHRREVERQRAADVPPLVVPRVNSTGIVELPDEAAGSAAQVPRTKAALAASQPGMPEGAAFDAQVVGSASRATQELIQELDVATDARIPYVLQRLQQEAAIEASSAMTGVKATRRVVRAGGALWAESKQPMKMAAARKPKPGAREVPDRERVKCEVRPLGIADFRRVEQRLCCYEPGEVAHIENVLIGESKERSTRRLRRTEDTLTVVRDDETVQERDNQTANRFEVQKESTSVMQFDISLESGVKVAGSYGVMKIEADARFATSFSTQQSDRKATKYAQEVTERAVERITTRVREERITRVVEEFEETNKHGLDNAKGEAHIVGLYRWLDKVYEARVVNYGKRTMYEFLVPEPGAFHLHAMTKASSAAFDGLEEPIDPRTDDISELGLAKLTSHNDITEWGYAAYAAAYDAEVDPPPAPMITVSKAYHREGMDQTVQFAESKNDLQILNGYEAQRFDAPFGLHSESQSGGDNWVTIAIGRRSRFSTSGGTFSGVLNGEDNLVPVIIMGRTRFFAVNVEVICDRTPVSLIEWKIKTFNAIIAAYNNKLAEYQNALAEARAMAGVVIEGTNPALNRQIEQTELRKASIRLLARHCNPLWSDAMHDDGECGYPEFDCCEAMSDGAYAAFVEQAFEWSLMTYLFYPYFWGRKCNWEQIYQLEDVDPLFQSFLQAGYARVIVPVREGYEKAALAFIKEGKVWDGAEVPVIGDPLYLAIVNEMKTAVGVVDPTIKPWPVRVPTTLVALQCESGCIPGSGLPCPCEDDEPNP